MMTANFLFLKAFHIYSMKQAIEEGFILDVLQNYITYKTYYQLNKEIEVLSDICLLQGELYSRPYQTPMAVYHTQIH